MSFADMPGKRKSGKTSTVNSHPIQTQRASLRTLIFATISYRLVSHQSPPLSSPRRCNRQNRKTQQIIYLPFGLLWSHHRMHTKEKEPFSQTHFLSFSVEGCYLQRWWRRYYFELNPEFLPLLAIDEVSRVENLKASSAQRANNSLATCWRNFQGSDFKYHAWRLGTAGTSNLATWMPRNAITKLRPKLFDSSGPTLSTKWLRSHKAAVNLSAFTPRTRDTSSI